MMSFWRQMCCCSHTAITSCSRIVSNKYFRFVHVVRNEKWHNVVRSRDARFLIDCIGSADHVEFSAMDTIKVTQPQIAHAHTHICRIVHNNKQREVDNKGIKSPIWPRNSTNLRFFFLWFCMCSEFYCLIKLLLRKSKKFAAKFM